MPEDEVSTAEETAVEEPASDDAFDIFDASVDLNPPDSADEESEEYPLSRPTSEEGDGTAASEEEGEAEQVETEEAGETDQALQDALSGEETAGEAENVQTEEGAPVTVADPVVDVWRKRALAAEARAAEHLQQLTKSAAPAEPATTPGAEPQFERVFNIDLPDNVVEAVMSGDLQTAKAGLMLIVNGVAELTRRRILQDNEKFVASKLNSWGEERTRASEQAAETQKGVKEFYETYPDLALELRPQVVKLVLTNLLEQDPNLLAGGWTKAIQARVAQHTNQVLGLQAKPPVVAPTGKVAPGQKAPTPVRPPKLVRAGSRPSSSPKKGSSQVEDIRDLLSGLH